MKNIFVLFFVVFSANAQLIRPIFGLGYSRNSQFSNSSYYNLKTGIEVNLKKIIKPEIELNYFLGGLDNQSNYNSQGSLIDVFGREFSVLNIGFCPKIVVFEDEDQLYYFQILPKYNFSKIKATGEYLVVNQNNSSQSILETEVLSDTKQSVGLGFGIVFKFSKNKKSDALAINLLYQNIDTGSLISKLNHNNSTINTKDVFSFEIVYYINLSNKK